MDVGTVLMMADSDWAALGVHRETGRRVKAAAAELRGGGAARSDENNEVTVEPPSQLRIEEPPSRIRIQDIAAGGSGAGAIGRTPPPPPRPSTRGGSAAAGVGGDDTEAVLIKFMGLLRDGHPRAKALNDRRDDTGDDSAMSTDEFVAAARCLLEVSSSS